MKRLTAIMLALALVPHAAAGDKPANPLVRVVTLSHATLVAKPGKPRLDWTISRLDRAASFKPDIVCLPETFTRGEPEPVPGPTTRRMSQWAQDHSCYVICTLYVRREGKTYNSAVLIDRAGKIVGRYDKIHPTEGELNKKICPGRVDPPVFATDFGKIGIQICFDVNWHDQWRRLKAKGARIIFYPSAYPAARQVKTLAWLNQCFVVSSTLRSRASIVDITGDTIQTTGKYQSWAGAVLPLDKQLFEIDYHVGKMRQLQKKYGNKVRITWHHDDDLVTLASLDPDLTMKQLIEEYKLTPHPDYIQRAQLAQDRERPAATSEEKVR